VKKLPTKVEDCSTCPYCIESRDIYGVWSCKCKITDKIKKDVNDLFECCPLEDEDK
jgi:hypothetical protein